MRMLFKRQSELSHVTTRLRSITSLSSMIACSLIWTLVFLVFYISTTFAFLFAFTYIRFTYLAVIVFFLDRNLELISLNNTFANMCLPLLFLFFLFL